MNIINEVKKQIDQQSTNSWALLSNIGPIVAAFNLPLAITFLTIGEIAGAVESKTNLQKTTMSDDWLTEVSKSDVSQEGLAFLAKKLSMQGFVSVQDAADWMEIENVEAKKRETAQKIYETKKHPGASALLERAKRECGSMLNPDIFTKGLDLVEKVIPDGISKSIFSFGRKVSGK